MPERDDITSEQVYAAYGDAVKLMQSRTYGDYHHSGGCAHVMAQVINALADTGAFVMEAEVSSEQVDTDLRLPDKRSGELIRVKVKVHNQELHYGHFVEDFVSERHPKYRAVIFERLREAVGGALMDYLLPEPPAR